MKHDLASQVTAATPVVTSKNLPNVVQHVAAVEWSTTAVTAPNLDHLISPLICSGCCFVLQREPRDAEIRRGPDPEAGEQGYVIRAVYARSWPTTQFR
ncbi:hypothetical protein Y032_0174g445 [Ancylostoma ceylanicum]|uniref:Uncharacterized protein n=1 Tax=Ancylostoma ceylanicum TaxID=53326 RepID=A0A016SUV3_9BILA|nr:hypothetical protein Y032_0174g445 [Ancylostoma ceylanicum]